MHAIMFVTNKTPHKAVPSTHSSTPRLAPLPSMPIPMNLRCGYNPSTSSSPTRSANGVSSLPPSVSPSPSPSPLPSPQQSSRSKSPPPMRHVSRANTLAPPRARVSRSASPLGRSREPMLPDIDKLALDGNPAAVHSQMGIDRMNHTSKASSTADHPYSAQQCESSSSPSVNPLPQPQNRSGSPLNFSYRSSADNSRTTASATAMPLARSATACKQGTTLSRTSSGSGRMMRGPPPPIAVPAPPVPAVPAHWRDSAVSSIASRNVSGIESSRTSQASNYSHLSHISHGSSSSSYRSSVDSESAAVARTLSATASIKSDKSVKEKKRSRFLGKRKTKNDIVIPKPLISPPTLLQTEDTSTLPRLRNRDSMGARSREKPPIMEDNTNESARGLQGRTDGMSERANADTRRNKTEPILYDKLESKDADEMPRSTTKRTDTAATTASIDSAKTAVSQKLKKSKTLGLPWTKGEKRIPEGHEDLVEGGFFTRTQLPPVKYTRLPVLAVSASDLEKAETDVGAGVRVSMQLQPVVWYEGRRKTMRMSLQMTQTSTEGTADGEQHAKRTSWIPASRFSWLPGQDDQLAHLRSPLRSATSPKKSPLKSPLDIVGEEQEHEGEGVEDTRLQAMRQAAAARLESVDETADVTSIETVLKDAPRYPAQPHGLVCDGAPLAKQAELARTELESNEAKANESRNVEEERQQPPRWSGKTNGDGKELVKVLEQIAREQTSEGIDAQKSGGHAPVDAIFELPSVPSNRISMSLRQLAATLGEPERQSHAGDTEHAIEADLDELTRPSKSNNRLSWMFNTGAPPPQNVKLLAAVPRNDADMVSAADHEDDPSAADAGVELRILSAYNLPEQAQVLAVIAEEDEVQETVSAEPNEADQDNADRDSKLVHVGDSWPMMVSSPGLPNMRMIGMAEVEEDPSDEETSAYGVPDDESASAYSGDSNEEVESREPDIQRQGKVASYIDEDSQQVVARDGNSAVKPDPPKVGYAQPLRLQSKADLGPSPPATAFPHYIPGPIRLTRPEDVYRRNSIAGMGMWSDTETTESTWQRIEKGLIEGILDYFGDMVSTSAATCGAEEGKVNDGEEVEDEVRWRDAPLLDHAFIQLHAVDDIFAETIDPSKPPPLPPQPTNIVLNRPLSSPGFDLTSSAASLKSVSSGVGSVGSIRRAASQRKPKPVAVHSPGIGSLLMKHGLF